MKLLYGCSKSQRNFIQGIQRTLGKSDSFFVMKYSQIPRDLSAFSGFIFAGDTKSFFYKQRNLENLINDLQRDNVLFFYLGRYFDKPEEIISNNSIRIRSSNRTLKKICSNILNSFQQYN